MNKNNNNYIDTLYLALGEIPVIVLTIVGYLALGKFDWTVISGTILGSIITVINFFILSVSINNALQKFIDVRGDKEMTDEEVEKLSKEHSLAIQSAVTKSYVLRTALMMGSLVVAFITKLFNPLATLIPLMMYKPIIYLIELLRKKRGA